jgi:hypothetical protein
MSLTQWMWSGFIFLAASWWPSGVSAQGNFEIQGDFSKGDSPALRVPTGGSGRRSDEPDAAGMGALLCRGRLLPMLWLYQRMGGKERAAACGCVRGTARTLAGRGGGGGGSMAPYGCFTTIGQVGHSRKRSQCERSHNPSQETSRKAQCGKTARRELCGGVG